VTKGRDRTPLPAAVVRRGTARLLRRRDHNGQALACVYFEDEPGREQHPTLTLAEAMDALWWHGGLLPPSRGDVALGVLRGRGLP
jgi:hypothetical protein